MSKLSEYVHDLIKKVFPHHLIKTEHYVKYKGTRLFFDFYIKELNVLVEVQGKQHYGFVKHFHTDKNGYVKSKKRDNLKKEYCQENNMTLVEINSEITKRELADKIWKGMGNGSKTGR